MNTPSSNRRRFIGAAIATAASYGRILGANDRIRVGGIGTGGRGQYLLSNVVQIEGAEIVALCDVYEPHRLRAKSKYATSASDTVDYRQVLDRKDIDAVVIGTPDHWHVPITIDAVKAGKDVYCEKPVTHRLEEGEPLLAAVKDSGRVVQTGTQQRSWAHYIHAKELIDARRARAGHFHSYVLVSESHREPGHRARNRPFQARLEALPRPGSPTGPSTPTSIRTGAGTGISAAAR